MHLTKNLACAASGVMLFALFAFARDHGELNGTWRLVPAQSEFAGQPAIQSGTVTISDRDGITVLERNFTYSGAEKTYFYRDELGNEHGHTVHASRDLKTKTKWDHDILRVTTTSGGLVTQESYALNPDGTMMADVETPDHRTFRLMFRRE